MSFALRSLRPVAAATSRRFQPLATLAVAPSSSITSVANASKFNKKAVALPSNSLLRSRSVSTDERPISPHVTIYSFPLPAFSSITHRATGMAMSAGVMGMGLVALAGGCDIPSYVETMKTSVPVLMPLVKTLVAFPIVYHTAAGCRHLYWDKTAKGLDLATLEMGTKALIAGTVVVSLGLGFYTLPALK